MKISSMPKEALSNEKITLQRKRRSKSDKQKIGANFLETKVVGCILSV